MRNIIKKILILTIAITLTTIINTSFAQNPGPLLSPGLGFGGMGLGNEQFIYNTEIENIVDTSFGGEYDGEGNPTRIGTYWISGEGTIEGLVGTSDIIENYETALTKVLHVIQNIVNYTLGILGLIALIYIMIHGFIILTAAGDDTKAKKGFKGIKNAFVAIAGIGLSWLIISGILRLINTVAA